MAAQMSESLEDGIGIARAAGDEEAVERQPIVGMDGGARLQNGVGIGVARQQHERNALIGTERGQFIDAILEIGDAADKAEHDETRLGDGLFEPHIHREIVGEAQDIGEAQPTLPCPVGGASQHGQFAIGGGGEDIGAGRLSQVDGLAFLLNSAGLSGEQVHQGLPRGARAAAISSQLTRVITSGLWIMLSLSALCSLECNERWSQWARWPGYCGSFAHPLERPRLGPGNSQIPVFWSSSASHLHSAPSSLPGSSGQSSSLAYPMDRPDKPGGDEGGAGSGRTGGIGRTRGAGRPL